jgi:hypothetical protein
MRPTRRRPFRPALIRPALWLAAALSLAALAPAAAAGETEWSLGLSFNYPRLDRRYLHAFIPPLQSGPATGSGSQTLTFDSYSGIGVDTRLTFFLQDHLGIQFSYEPFSADLKGTSTAYQLSLRYNATVPPDTAPREYTYSEEREWFTLTGEHKVSVLALDLIYRIGSNRGLAIDLAAGVSYLSLKGYINPAGYTVFSLTAKGALLLEEYQFDVAYGPWRGLGGNVGVGVTIFVGPNFGLFVDGRYHVGPELKGQARLEIPDGTEFDVPLDPKAEGIPTAELKIKPAFFRIAAGFRIAF